MDKRRIMVVEDESVVMEYINSHLRALGYDVVATAASGEAAVRAADEHQPELILMDIRLKGEVDGIEAAAKIQEELKIPIVYLTAYSDDTTLERAKKTEPMGYLMKPFERSELKSTIEIALSKHRADSRVQESEVKFRSIFENSLDTVFITDPGGRIIDINAAGTAFFDYPKTKLVGMNIADLFFRPSDRSILKDVVEKKEAIRDREFSFRMQDGNSVMGVASIVTLRDPAGAVTGYQGVIRDVSERRQLEQQLFQAVKMGAVGRLASGIAHDFNNLLTVIVGYAERLMSQNKDNEGGQKCVQRILSASEKAAELIKKILLFSRKQESYPVALNVNEVTAEFKNMIARVLGEGVTVTMDPGADLDSVYADPSQFEQVLMNVVVNARDAMPEGGEITIATRNRHLDESFVKEHRGARKGDYVDVVVSDTGKGIDPRHLDRIFEPFFTTKDRAEGTGLGLATVYGIVKNHRGYIYADSAVDRGTTFHILFPKLEKAIDDSDRQQITEELDTLRDRVVLLVEDEKNVRELTRAMLESLGMRVLAAADAQEGVRIATIHSDPIDLLVLDVVLVDVPGPELALEIAEHHPESRVLFISGYPEAHIRKLGVDLKKHRFLRKPFFKTDLYVVLRDILNDSSPRRGSSESKSRRKKRSGDSAKAR